MIIIIQYDKRSSILIAALNDNIIYDLTTTWAIDKLPGLKTSCDWPQFTRLRWLSHLSSNMIFNVFVAKWWSLETNFKYYAASVDGSKVGDRIFTNSTFKGKLSGHPIATILRTTLVLLIAALFQTNVATTPTSIKFGCWQPSVESRGKLLVNSEVTLSLSSLYSCL